jgi:hypothetical protein
VPTNSDGWEVSSDLSILKQLDAQMRSTSLPLLSGNTLYCADWDNLAQGSVFRLNTDGSNFSGPASLEQKGAATIHEHSHTRNSDRRFF